MRSLFDPSLVQTETIEIPIIHEPPVEPTTDVQAKVQKLKIRSPVLGLTVPLPNSFSGTGRKSALTNINRVIKEGQVYSTDTTADSLKGQGHRKS